VRAVAAVTALPFHPHAIDAKGKLQIRGRAIPDPETPIVYTTVVTPDYFSVLGIALKRGRPFNERDRAGAPKVVLINEALARRYFPGEDPVGQSVIVGAMSKSEPREIVGVVGDVRPLTLESEARPELFVPFAQNISGSVTFVVHTTKSASAMLPLLRERFWSVDKRQSIYWSATVEELVGATLIERRFNLILLALFSAIALVLASVGIYGLISFGTQQRVNEIGVRLALGAERGQIVRMIILQGIRLALPGVALGVLGALLLTRFLRAMLFGVEPTDLTTFVELAVLMILLAAAAAWVPAQRAVRAAPINAILSGEQPWKLRG
jgi:putative ABC transport system permease protein